MTPPSFIRLWIPGAPVPCGRARVVKRADGRSHAFNPKTTSDYQEHVRLTALAARGNTVPFGFGAVAYREASFGVTLWVARASRRGDTDNFAKSVLDACTKVFWHDDEQVKELAVFMFDGESEPGVLMDVSPLREDLYPRNVMRRYRQGLESLAGKSQSNLADVTKERTENP